MSLFFSTKEMPLIELETQINAPMERVFDLARSIDAHMKSTEDTPLRHTLEAGLRNACER